jgi:hypothetical protein
MQNYRQGDVPLIPYTGSLDGFEAVKAQAGKLVLALGEATGHHHRLEGCSFSFGTPDNHRLFRDHMTGAQILEVAGGGADLLHEEHETINFAPGRYLQLVQVEDDGEMISQVVD